MKWIGLAAAVVVLHQSHAISAYACVPLPAVVSPLLPLDGATDVGVDAVLIASRYRAEPPEFELLRAALGDAGQEASAEKVELAVDCAQRGYLCIAKPVAPLVSHGRYEWRVTSSSVGSSDWRSFVTSDVRTVPFELPSVEARVVSETIGSSCGDFQTWEVQGGEFDGPAVFSASGTHWFSEPVALTGESWSEGLVVPLRQPCLEGELIAPNGDRRRVGELCLESREGCTAGPSSPGHLAWLSGLALAWSAAWRRRGVRRKSAAQS